MAGDEKIPWQLREMELTDQEVETLLKNARIGKGCLVRKPRRVKLKWEGDEKAPEQDR